MRLVWSTIHPPCCICGDAQKSTTGVAYGSPHEVKFYCREHLPEEYDEKKIKAKWRKR